MARSGAAGARRRRPPAGDVTEDDARLRAQLHDMGLYAADTLGDGNCLFRALADQLYGDARHHARLRAATCDQLAAHPERYAAFVETEKPFDQYVAAMRTPGTYGGHLELAAFAHRFQKPIRIVQPDLVYVVACDDASRQARAARARRERARQAALEAAGAAPADAPTDARAARRAARRAKRGHAPTADDDARAPLETVGPLCIAYHNWEHYSSLRSLRGPHTGLPRLALPSDAEEHAQKEHEDEALVLRSVPGTSRAKVRRMLYEWEDWETVVEKLLEGDDDDDDEEEEEEAAADDDVPPPAARRRARRGARPPTPPAHRELAI
ncbi:ubiquitinyl hydrolase 1 [Malassezia brasiliensis]|uniref:Ubiquitinyl hydrolase 1 n=1 Tax=Malassezia brasiliensis TaxID=1821822 RepID=A0AAF0DWS8_9BASI|nr:ubiquitinyl hydrolase 1 [Malassezia brasiliensis]